MLVSHSKKFIYLKTGKTAGTSVEMALQHHCLPEGMVVGEETDCIETNAGIVGARGRDVSGQPWWNHMTAREIREKIPGDLWVSYCKICNIRNPWDKTVSAFHMAFPKIKNETTDVVFSEFRSWVVGPNNLLRDTEIYFIDGKPVADVYIRYHRLAEDLKAIEQRLGLDMPSLPEAKSNYRGKVKIPYQDYYDMAAKKKIERIYRLEIEHFGWTFD